MLLVTASLGDEAYGVTITLEIEKRLQRKIGFNTVHTTLQRLEHKGLVSSRMGGATSERGGRRKRFFAVTARGVRVLKSTREVREKLWETIPASIIELSRG